MKMTMSTYTKGETVLLKIWDTGTIPGLVFAMLTSLLLAALLEFIHVIARKATVKTNVKTAKYRNKKSKPCSETMKTQILVTFYHVLHVAIGYCLMLFVMTYNIWIYLSVVLGSGMGYYLVHSFSSTSDTSEDDEEDVPLPSPINRDEKANMKVPEEEALYSDKTEVDMDDFV